MNAELLRIRPRSRRARDHRHAVIDIGSNTVRLVIYGGPPRAPAVLWNEKVSARLGRDLANGGVIPEAAMDEALAALARYAAILREQGIARVDTVATAAPREAANGGEFVRRVEALGLRVTVLSGEEEACASAYGAIGAFPDAEGVVADLGGGSLELIAIADGTCGRGATFPLGTLRLRALRAAGRFEHKVARLLKQADWARGGDTMYMIGGTWRAFAAYAMRSTDHPLTDPHGLAMSPEDAGKLALRLTRAEPAKLALQRGISAMRAEKLPDAAALLRVLIAELAPKALVFSSWGLREGLYYRSLPERERVSDPLIAGVTAFTANLPTGDIDTPALASWAAGMAPGAPGEGASLRLAAAQLAIALQRVEPNLRAAQALEWALDKRWIGIDFRGRALLAAALRGSLGITAPHPRLHPLANEADLREATGWGLAFRLGLRLGAGAGGPLSASRLMVSGGQVELELSARHAPLVTRPVEKDLAALADWLGTRPKLSIIA